MSDNIIKKAKRLAHRDKVKYTIFKKLKKEAIDVTQFVEKINKINLSPQQLRELGLSHNWQKNVSVQFIEKVVKAAERFKKDLKELSKR